MATSNRNGRVLYRYGICLNDQCSKCKSKEVQEIGARKEFVCTECGKQLRECPRPKTWWEKNGKMAIVAAITTVVAVAVGIYLSLNGDNNKSVNNEPELNEQVKVDTTKTEPAIIETPKATENKSNENPVKKEPTKTTGTLNLSYGKYTGEIKNGKPNGQGRLVYTKEHLINKNDLKERMALPGEYVQGIFVNGEITIGQYFDEEGNLIAALNFGVPASDE